MGSFTDLGSGSTPGPAGPAGPAASANERVEYIIINAAAILAKQVVLSGAPASATRTKVDIMNGGGGCEEYGVDFTVAGAILDWNGLNWDTQGIFASGERLRITYFV